MARVVQFLVALNAIGGVLTYLGIRWGARRAKERIRGKPDEVPSLLEK